MMRSCFLLIACAAAAVAQRSDTLHLNLAEAEKLAIQNNPRIAGAKLTAAAAYQVPTELRANMQPVVSGNLTGVGADSGSRLAAGGLNNPVVYNRIGTGVSVSQLISDFGRTGNLVESAKFRAQAQDQTAQATKAQVLLATDQAYFGLLRAQAVLKVAQETVSARQLLVDQVDALAEAKLKSSLDVSFAKVNLADARLLLASALNGVQAAEAELATATGLPNQEGFVPEDVPMPPLMPDQIDPLLRTALDNRPELAGLRLQQNAEERFAKAERALMFPSVGLISSAGFVPTGQDAVPGRYGAIGLNITVPVFNGGLYKARRAEAELRARAAGENVNDLANRVMRDVRMAYLNAATAYERVGLTEQMLQQAQLGVDLAQSRYDLGISSIIELSQAQLNLTTARIASSSGKYDYLTQRSILAYQTGELR